jgi:transcription initiation factor TFIIE subunit beta
VTSDGRYMFKPPYRIRDRKGLLKLLRQTDLKGFGGILLDDIQESLPNHEKVLKVCANRRYSFSSMFGENFTEFNYRFLKRI